jgi:general secretion pathway protein G
MKRKEKTGVTLLELLVVVLIIGILSTIAVTVYVGQVERARYAAAHHTIRSLELAVTRYEIDVGQYPPSSSGPTLNPVSPISPSTGCGYLQVALLHSLSGDVYHPLDKRWLGPYMEFDQAQLSDLDGSPVSASTPKSQIQFLDPWGTPYTYTRSQDYDAFGGTELWPDDPYRDTETYYNPKTIQIFSMGANGTTYPVPYRGLETDDVTNW